MPMNMLDPTLWTHYWVFFAVFAGKYVLIKDETNSLCGNNNMRVNHTGQVGWSLGWADWHIYTPLAWL